MGIYIKGMEMPKDYSVIVKIFPDGRVGKIPYVQWFKVDLIPGTQAVPVPPSLFDELDALAISTGVSKREMIREATMEYVKRHTAEEGET